MDAEKWLGLSEGFSLMLTVVKPDRSLSSREIGFCADSGWLSVSSITSMYKFLP